MQFWYLYILTLNLYHNEVVTRDRNPYMIEDQVIEKVECVNIVPNKRWMSRSSI